MEEIKDKILEKTLSLTLNTLNVKSMADHVIEFAKDDIRTKIINKGFCSLVSFKCFIDDILGDKKEKFHDFIADLML